MPKSKLIRTFAGFVAVLVVLGFLVLYGIAIYNCWAVASEKLPTFSSEYVYVATALAGLVGGVVAMVFNEKLPDISEQEKRKIRSDPTTPTATPSASGVTPSFEALKNSLSPSSEDALQSIAAGYVVIYFITGVASIITWVHLSAQTPDLVKNIALISFGLSVAIARSFFNVPQRER